MFSLENKSNLESKKADKEQENQDLQAKVEKAEQEKVQLEEQKQELETQKQELLSQTLNSSEGFAKGIGATSSVEAMKQQIAKHDENIAQIRNEKNTQISEIKTDIQALEVKLKDVQAKEEREKFLSENKASIGLGLTGEELVDVARQMLDKYGSSTGWCATGVSRTFEMAYGLSLHGNGCD